MKVVVFGANGKVGTKLVRQLLNDSHDVRAFVHGASSLSENENLVVIYGDIRNQSQVYDAIKGTDVVFSTLGSWSTKSKDILTSGMLSIIPAMEILSVNRIISLTGAGAFTSNDQRSLLDKMSRQIMMRVAGKVLTDGENHIKLLQESRLDWTVIRSPIMKQTDSKQNYNLSNTAPSPWATINRDSVAMAMIQQIYNRQWIKKAPFILNY